MAFSELNDSSVLFSFMIPSTDQDMDDVTLGEMLTAAHRGQVDYCVPGGMSVSQSSSSVVFDRAGNLGERDVDQSIGFGVTRNTYSTHSKFSENTQAEKVVDRTGKPVEKAAQMHRLGPCLMNRDRWLSQNTARKLGDPLSKETKIGWNCWFSTRRTSSCSSRRSSTTRSTASSWTILLQQSLELREAHQRSLTEMEELRKFQSSTLDTIARRKLVEDQNTILELSGRIQELQNEINCMNDSKDFQDAESIRSGNSHVTSRPVSFPPHPIPEGMLSRSFGVQSRREGRQAFGTHMVYRETFLQIQVRLHQHLILQELNPWWKPLRSRFIYLQRRKVGDQNKIRIWDASPDRQPKNQSSSVEETLQRNMVQTNNDCRFQIFISTNSLHQPRLFADAMDQRSGVGWLSGWIKIFVIYTWYFNARFWSTWCEDCFSAEQNHPEFSFQRRISLEEQKAQKEDRFLRSRQIAYLIYEQFRVTGIQWCCRELCRPVHY